MSADGLAGCAAARGDTISGSPHARNAIGAAVMTAAGWILRLLDQGRSDKRYGRAGNRERPQPSRRSRCARLHPDSCGHAMIAANPYSPHLEPQEITRRGDQEE